MRRRRQRLLQCLEPRQLLAVLAEPSQPLAFGSELGSVVPGRFNDDASIDLFVDGRPSSLAIADAGSIRRPWRST